MTAICRINTFYAYGLDREKNFVEPNICDCCGLATPIQFEDIDDLFDYCSEVLFMYDFENIAIFLCSLTGDMYAVVKLWDEDREDWRADIIVANERGDYSFFSELATELELEGYALMTECNNNKWRYVWN